MHHRPALWSTALACAFLAMPFDHLHAAEYHVAPEGNDASSGTADTPFRTISRAAARMQAGDTCVIHEGVYRETVRPANSGTPNQPVRFVCAPNEVVVVSGAQPITGKWARAEKGHASVALSEPPGQVFLNGQPMMEARWPNAPLVPVMTRLTTRAEAGQGTDYTVLCDTALPAGDFRDARVLIWPGSMWNNSVRHVTDYRPGTSLAFDPPFEAIKEKYHKQDPYRPKPTNPYILFGSLAALDQPGEWHFDQQAKLLTFAFPPPATPDNALVEVRHRDYGFNLEGLAHVEIIGLRLFAAAINMREARHCLVHNCQLQLVEHFSNVDGFRAPDTKNFVSGKGNIWRRCRITGSAGAAIQLAGTGNQLDNCIVEDANYLGINRAAVQAGGSQNAVIQHCSIFRAGRDLIGHGRAAGIKILYNDLHHPNMLSNDTGATYAWKTESRGSVIAYNWIHDIKGHTNGIYLDNFCDGFHVHHNVIWNARNIRLNSDATNHLIANNTLFGDRPFGVFCYYNYTPNQSGTRIVNNLVVRRVNTKDPATFVQGPLGPSYEHNGRGAIDARGVPERDSEVIDAGVPIPGITDGFQGKAPDLGAYEHGAPYWKAGADWGDVATHTDLAWRLPPPLTEQTMIRKGLLVWLDASDSSSCGHTKQGKLLSWQDRSDAKRTLAPGAGVSLDSKAINGRPAVRFAGSSSLALGTLREQPGELSIFLVAASSSEGNRRWQRLLAAWDGKTTDDYLAPSWILSRPRSENEVPFPPQLFTLQLQQAPLRNLVLGGGARSRTHFFVGNVGELLVFDRCLDAIDAERVEAYLSNKWRLKEE